eukprot:CAMPEP_0197570782 /NCGR_PEP_ID=MMETSP1320-20131121/41326_1 /TAXON_ID=91990 /ORGANISM="Bolidomonas sp., Strain RCC2347" /LENGTH=109 /DNA_ID=CAMNT_0043133235 /DNA_START=258 /DNA_END=587 /DNA_ORIENTATION=-
MPVLPSWGVSTSPSNTCLDSAKFWLNSANRASMLSSPLLTSSKALSPITLISLAKKLCRLSFSPSPALYQSLSILLNIFFARCILTTDCATLADDILFDMAPTLVTFFW